MLRLMQLRLAAVGLFAAAAVFLTAASAWAFTRETVWTDGNGNSTFADPDSRVTNSGPSSHPFGANGPTVQFGGQQGQIAPFGRFQGYGDNSSAPDPYSHPLGNGN